MEVLVLGGGYAGTRLVRELERRLPRAVDIRLVDDTGDHVVQHELHRVLRFPQLAETIRVPLDEIVDRTDVITDQVVAVDENTREVTLASGERLTPDILAICLGALTATSAVPGVAEHGQPLKRLDDAHRIRRRFTSLAHDSRVIVGGAGLSGIQVAGELAAARNAGGPDCEILLIEQETTVAPQFPDPFRRAVADALSEAGVIVRTGSLISHVDGSHVGFADGEMLSADQVIWTGGIVGPAPTENRRLRVRSDLRVAPRTFALGDAALVIDDSGKRVPAAAQTAVRQATVAADNIDRLVTAATADRAFVFEPRLSRYEYSSPGWVVSVGDDAVAMVGDRVVRGGAARAVKASVNAAHLGSIGEIKRALDAVTEAVGLNQPGTS